MITWDLSDPTIWDTVLDTWDTWDTSLGNLNYNLSIAGVGHLLNATGNLTYPLSLAGIVAVLNTSNISYPLSIAGNVNVLNTSNLNFLFSLLSSGGLSIDIGNLNFRFSSSGNVLVQYNVGNPTYRLSIASSGIVLNPIYCSGNPTYRFSTNGSITQILTISSGNLNYLFNIHGISQQEVDNNNYLRQFINDNPIIPANGVYTAPAEPTGFDDELEYLKDFMGIE